MCLHCHATHASGESREVSYTIDKAGNVTADGKTYSLTFLKSSAESAIYVNNSNADGNSKSLKIGGKTFNVGDTIVCTYKLKTPAVLENYQARIKYDSSKLTCKSAKMSEPAKNGAMLNIKIAGEISLSGVNIGDGYDYTNGGTFMTVVYEVKGGGSTSPSYHWEVACRASDSKNLIDKKGKPASGFKLSSSYKD